MKCELKWEKRERLTGFFLEREGVRLLKEDESSGMWSSTKVSK